MVIAILGGTGKEGAALALRWAKAGHRVIIGSRDPARAASRAVEMNRLAGRQTVEGMSNLLAAQAGEVVVLTVPYAGQRALLEEVRGALTGKVVVDTVVPLDPTNPRRYTVPPAGSAAQEAQALLPESKVVAAFHHIAAHELAELGRPVDSDLLVAGNDKAAKQQVLELGQSTGLRSYDVGGLEQAQTLERLTPLLIGLNIRYKSKRGGIRITGFPPS